MKPKDNLIIEAEQLTVSYGQSIALYIENLQLAGNIVALVGHNGAGKSTFIKTVLDLLPHRGALRLRRTGLTGDLPLIPEQHMAFCPETGAVFADISVEAYIKLWCRIKQRDANYYKRQGAPIIDLLEIGPLLTKLGRELSKGQRRRVQTAIGFLMTPQLFLFDEPFDGLDVRKSRELSEVLTKYSEQMSMLISSHRMDVVERLADRIIVLKQGRVVAAGSVREVCLALCPQCVFIRQLTSLEEMLPRLRAKYPTAVVQRIGDEIAINGANICMHDLSKFVQLHANNGAPLREERVGLVEAMSFHLEQDVVKDLFIHSGDAQSRTLKDRSRM